MAKVMTKQRATTAGYALQGTLLEACSCGILCPCWVGEDPDGGKCYSANAYHFTRGTIGDVDVSGLSFITVNLIPGNVLAPGSWKVVHLIDDRATEAQQAAISGVYRGEYGGPLADLAALVGEVLGTERARIEHEVAEGNGTLRVPGVIEATMSPYRAPDKKTVTTLRDSLFSTVPGSPAWVGKASLYRVRLPKYGIDWQYEGRNAIQSEYRIEHKA